MEASGYEDFIDNAPSKILQVSYNGTIVQDGNVLTPKQTAEFPDIVLNNEDESALYTLIITDPDAPSRNDPVFREFIHYVCVNIKGNQLNTGDVVASYVGPAPPCNSGLHRYYFVVYKQISSIDVEQAKEHFKGRGGIKSNPWAITHCEKWAYAWTMFQAQFDETCDESHEAIGFVPPPYFRSPKQIEKYGDA